MEPDRNHKTRTLWLSGVLHVFTHLYQVALMPLYLLIQEDLHLQSVSQATLLLTVMMVGYFAPSYPMGILADRVSRKKLLGFGLALNGTGFVLLAFAPNYSWALGAVVLAGFGGSFYHPAATAMVARLFPVGTGKALGLVGIGASVGFFAGPLYAGWRAGALMASHGAHAWRTPIAEFGVAGILTAIAFAWLADEEKLRPAPASKERAANALFPTPSLWLFFIFCALAFSLRDFAGASLGSLSSLFLQKAHGFDPGWTGLALSGIFIASAVSNPIFGGFSDRSRVSWLAGVLLCAAALIVLLPHVASRFVIPVFLIYGFFFMSSYPMTEAALMESVPDAVRGRVFGLFITITGLISNLSHWIVGAQVRKLGDAAFSVRSYFPLYSTLGLMMALSLAGLPCLRAIRKRESKPEPATKPHEALPNQPGLI